MGIYSQLGRRLDSERQDNQNRNIALLYASYRVLNSLFPSKNHDWRNMLTTAGLDPDDQQRNTTTPVGIGNMAGDAIIAARINDGMNQLGNENGCIYNCRPYANYLNYKPENSAYELIDPSRWQPDIKTSGNGLFTVQQFVTAEYGATLPYSYSDVHSFRAPIPTSSDHNNVAAYKAQMDEVLAASANLTDEAKVRAELFDNKYRGYAGAAAYAITRNRLTGNLDRYVHYFFIINVAAFDTGIAVWNEKYRYDTVRPYSAVDHLYGSSPVTAWGGPGKGTVSDIPGNQWRSYLDVADHPEYPSGSAAFCHAYAQASRRYLGSDTLGWSTTFAAGSSVVEPGLTPAQALTLTFPTWTDWVNACTVSRVDGGVHFRAAVESAQLLGEPIADVAFEFVNGRINGQVQ